MFDHLGLHVANFAKSSAFYVAALKPLGILRTNGGDDWISLGRDRRPQLFLDAGGATQPRLHLAFTAATRAEVRAFYRAAMRTGGRDNGRPGLRPNYHANYYAAFVLDPDGHNIEAVCKAAAAAPRRPAAKSAVRRKANTPATRR